MPKIKRPPKGLAIGLPKLGGFLESTLDIQRIMASGVNPDGSLRPETIRAVLRFCQIEIKAIAKELGVSDQYIHHVINRVRRDVRVEDLIAERLGIQSDRAWGRTGSPE